MTKRIKNNIDYTANAIIEILIFEYVKNIYIKELEKSDISPKIKSDLIDKLIDL